MIANLDRLSLCVQMLSHAFYRTSLEYRDAETALLVFFTQEEIDKANKILGAEDE